jgi:hypothetical protein
MQHYIPQKHGFRYVIVCRSTLHEGENDDDDDDNNNNNHHHHHKNSTHGVEGEK